MSVLEAPALAAANALDVRVAELESLALSESDLGRVFDRLMDFVHDFAGRGPRWNEVIVLKREQKEQQDRERAYGATQDSTSRKNELLDRALKLRDLVAQEAQTSVREESPPRREVAPVARGGQVSDPADLPIEEARELYKASQGGRLPPGPVTYCCSGLARGYRRGRSFRLRDVSIELRPGEITGLIGPNGSGKTTLLRLIVGELMPDAGLYGYPLLQPESDGPGTIDWSRVRSQIAHVRQRPDRWFGRVKSNLFHQAALFGLRGAENELEVEFLLERLGLAEFGDARWSELSGGYQMRFELARALVSRPRLLVLDEPLAPLDPDVQLRFLRDLKDLAASRRRPLAVMISSQHLYETESVADRLLFLHDGAPTFYGRREDVGANRKENVLELMTSVGREELERTFGELITTCEPRGQCTFVVRSPLSTEPQQLLAALVRRQIPVHYFRDLSRSTRSLFDGERPS